MGIDNTYLNQLQLYSMRHSSSTCLILNNWKGSFMSKQKLLFLCFYLTALTLMGITIQFFTKIYLAGIYMNDTWVSAPLAFFILITIVLFVRAYWIYRKIPKDYE